VARKTVRDIQAELEQLPVDPNLTLSCHDWSKLLEEMDRKMTLAMVVPADILKGKERKRR
jgi:hypothetical protein